MVECMFCQKSGGLKNEASTPPTVAFGEQPAASCFAPTTSLC
jgi:hypothetical protein